MSSKRKLPSLGLNRRVRARREDEWDPEPELIDEESSDEGSEQDVPGDQGKNDDSASDSDADADSDSESEASDQDAPKVDFAAVSFGALARAQASLPPTDRKSKKSKTAAADDEPVPEPASRPKYWLEGTGKAPKKRSSKHAPQEQTSKKPVSRRREIIADTRRQYRDPRFDSLGGPADEAKARRAYAFLDEYRDSEMAELRVQIKKTKDADQKEMLKRQLLSMESKKKAQAKKDDEERILEEHRVKEKELVAQGKTPYYLKKSEQKKQVLTDRFAGMSKGQVDRAIERKRKKVAGKEKKELGSLQRVRDRH